MDHFYFWHHKSVCPWDDARLFKMLKIFNLSNFRPFRNLDFAISFDNRLSDFIQIRFVNTIKGSLRVDAAKSLKL